MRCLERLREHLRTFANLTNLRIFANFYEILLGFAYDSSIFRSFENLFDFLYSIPHVISHYYGMGYFGHLSEYLRTFANLTIFANFRDVLRNFAGFCI